MPYCLSPHLIRLLGLTVGLCAFSLPAQAAPVTAAEKTHCLALGMMYTEISQKEGALLQTLRSTVTQQTVDDKQTFRDLEIMQQETAEIGAILKEVYADATPPGPEVLPALRNTPSADLLRQVEACIPES